MYPGKGRAHSTAYAYYTGAMRLAILHPGYSSSIGRALEHCGWEDNRRVLARWFCYDENVDKVVKILISIMAFDETT